MKRDLIAGTLSIIFVFTVIFNILPLCYGHNHSDSHREWDDWDRFTYSDSWDSDLLEDCMKNSIPSRDESDDELDDKSDDKSDDK